MNLKGLMVGGIAALSLAAASPAHAASMQQFWIVNFSHLDIAEVRAMNDWSRGRRNLMGNGGVLYYNPNKVPDLVQVLQPHGDRCVTDIEVVGVPGDEDGNYTAWIYDANICKPGQTFNVTDDDFNYNAN